MLFYYVFIYIEMEANCNNYFWHIFHRHVCAYLLLWHIYKNQGMKIRSFIRISIINFILINSNTTQHPEKWLYLHTSKKIKLKFLFSKYFSFVYVFLEKIKILKLKLLKIFRKSKNFAFFFAFSVWYGYLAIVKKVSAVAR